MSCSKCGRAFISNNLSAFPIEPKGTPDRKWMCEDCYFGLPSEHRIEYKILAKNFYNEKDPSKPIAREEYFKREEEKENGKTEIKTKVN
jgi:hypothetical protein